jgi:hypothetical protein
MTIPGVLCLMPHLTGSGRKPEGKLPFPMPLSFDIHSASVSGALSRLAAIGYCEIAVRERLGLEDLNDIQMRAIPIYRQERLTERDLLATAIDLFLLQGSVPVAELDQLFSGPDQSSLESAGILKRNGEWAKASASLYPVGRQLIFSDLAWPQMEIAGYSTVP